MSAVEIVVPGQPRGKGRPRFARAGFGVRTYTDAKTASYENLVKLAAAESMRGREPFAGPVRVDMLARMSVPASWSKRRQAEALADRVLPTGKPDADNLVKVLDALNGVVWRDDAQVVELAMRKCYSTAPAMLIRVESVEGGE